MTKKIYVSKRNENVTAKLDEAYSNEQTVMLEYLTGDKVGKTISITHSTLKRWWKETEIEDTTEDTDETDANLELLAGEDSKKQTETVVKEHELVPMPGIEKLENLKNQYPRKSKTLKIDRTKDIQNIIELLEDDYVYKYYPSVNCYKVFDIMDESKTIAEIYPQKKKISCYFKTLQGHNLQNVLFSREGYKYYLPARVDISYECDYINILNNLLMEV